MDIIAAFRWDSTEKSISYMIIDKNYRVRVIPTIKKLPLDNLNLLFTEAQNIIHAFFKEIEIIYRGNANCQISIEYKIVGHGSPAHNYHTRINKPSESTEFVRQVFFDNFDQSKKKNPSLQLADKQYRTNLKKPALTEFKVGLYNLNLIERQKNNAYQYHLWALALHATKSSYPKVLKKLNQIFKPEQEIQTNTKRRRST